MRWQLPSHAWLRHYVRMILLLLVPAVVLLIVAIKVLEPSARPTTPTQGSTQAKAAAAGYRFADGSRQVFPGNRLVALYGAPGLPVLGALGQQDPEAATRRAKQLAQQYAPLTSQKVMPALEIITTIASSEPTSNNDYSRETPVENLRPWIEAARRNDTYVILDLQPGSSDFESQAKQYAELLKQPHVGLALDPEWRLQPGKQHLVDIGSVGIDEVNRTASWLARLTRDNQLPQKVFLLHQFRLSMLPDRSKLDTSHTELAYIIQMDGQGPLDVKQQTYQAVTADPPANSRFGWKNFYAKDPTMLDPAQTMAQRPQPWYVSYQ